MRKYEYELEKRFRELSSKDNCFEGMSPSDIFSDEPLIEKWRQLL